MICFKINIALLFVILSVMVNVEAPIAKFTADHLAHNKRAEDKVDEGATNAQGKVGLYANVSTASYDLSKVRQTSWDPEVMKNLGLKPFEMPPADSEIKFVEGAKFVSKPVISSKTTGTQQIGGYTVQVADYRNRRENGY